MSGKGDVRTPWLARALLRRLAPPGRLDDLLGDLEEAHRRLVGRHGRGAATLLTCIEAVELAFALLRQRLPDGGGLRRRQADGQRRREAYRGPPGSGPTISLLDLELAFRMLVKYPGLTLVGGLSMAFAIWVGAVTFEVVGQMVSPKLPLEDGDRIVGIQNVDIEAGRPALPFLEDIVAWRTSLTTVEELGGFRSVSRNLILGEGGSEPVLVAEIGAAGFTVARVPPLLGRALAEADEQSDAPPVVVIGYDVWRTRFGGAPDVTGRTVRLGSTTATIVGVMPEGFGFPLHHDVWVPLQRGEAGLEPGGGGRFAVFGRLAPGRTAAEAQAELEVLGARRAAAFPEVLGQVRPRVLSYARSVRPLPDIGPLGLVAANLFMVMLLVLVCGNVALLMFARAATRESEIAVRSALGACRGRIVAQLFAEALVLGGVAALVGLVGAGWGVGWFAAMSEADSGGLVPFWMRAGLSPATVAYACGLTVLGAAVAGIGPALKVTGRQVESRLRRTAAGAGGMRLSGVWAGVIVAQVAVTVAFPATAFFFQRYVTHMRSLDLGFPAEQYLALRLEMDAESSTQRDEEATPAELVERLTTAQRALEERLAREPEVAGVTFANRLPGAAHPRRPVQVEEPGVPTEELAPHRVAEASVDVDFFRAVGAPVRTGRSFASGDPESDPGVVIVNQAFVDEILGGRSPVGRRVRQAAPAGEEPGPWHEIVGVAADLGMIGGDGFPRDLPGVYHPLARGVRYPLDMAIHVRGEPEAFASRLRTLATAVDPSLRLHEIRRLDRVSESRWRESEFLYRLLGGVSLVALVLSLTGIYSVLSFTVSRRTREIGVRVALGSGPGSVVASIFRRPVTHVLVGIAAGSVLVCLLSWGLTGRLTPRESGLVALYAALMFGVCMLACIVPTRRALGVEPTEALRAEG